MRAESELKQRFIEIFNRHLDLGVSDGEIVSDGRQMEMSDLEITTKWSAPGPLHVRNRDPWYLGVNWNTWHSLDESDRLFWLIDSVCSLSSDDWFERVVVWDQMDESSEEIDRMMVEEAADHGCLIETEARLDYELLWADELSRDRSFDTRWDPDIEIPTEKFRLPEMSDQTHYETLVRAESGSHVYWVPEIYADPDLDGVDVVSGERYVGLLRRTGERRIPVVLVE